MQSTSLSKTQNSVTYTGSAAWNKIPNYVREAQSLKSFLVKVHDYLVDRGCYDISVKINMKDSLESFLDEYFATFIS